MELDPQAYGLLFAVDWFARCGEEPQFTISQVFERVPDLSAAISGALGDSWQDARTRAQGDLTGYLAGRDYDAYGHWNALAKSSRMRIQQEVMPSVQSALTRIDATVVADSVLLDLNRFALFAAYNKRFSGVPHFFDQLFLVYQAGHFPCGWRGDMADWPVGKLLVF